VSPAFASLNPRRFAWGQAAGALAVGPAPSKKRQHSCRWPPRFASLPYGGPQHSRWRLGARYAPLFPRCLRLPAQARRAYALRNVRLRRAPLALRAGAAVSTGHSLRSLGRLTQLKAPASPRSAPPVCAGAATGPHGAIGLRPLCASPAPPISAAPSGHALHHGSRVCGPLGAQPPRGGALPQRVRSVG